MEADVSQPDAIESLAHARAWGAVVNCAGQALAGALEDVPAAEAERGFATMVLGPMRLAALVVPQLRRCGSGRLLNVTSVAGRTTAPYFGWYAATKHALDAATLAYRAECRGSGVEVAVIELGAVVTGIWADLADGLSRPAPRAGPHALLRAQVATRAWARLGADPARVGSRIAAILLGPPLRRRYVVGWDARTLAVLRRCAPSAVDACIARALVSGKRRETVG
jgi:short-subunit dehydrogenase